MSISGTVERDKPGAYALYVLGLLFAVNTLNWLDRVVVGVLVQSIKRELLLTDTQLSLLTGLAFVGFYLVAGIYIARLCDRGNRKMILAAGILLWSAATAATGLAPDFATLFTARMMVGVGEATAFPAAASLIADYFSPMRRPRAVSVFQSSNFLGVFLAFAVAGVIAQAYGWRDVFYFCGALGIVATLVLMFTLKEPERGRYDAASEQALPLKGLGATLAHLFRIPGFVRLVLGYGLAISIVSALATWGPAFLQRSHGLTIAQVGALNGPAVVIGGVIGALVAGLAATRLAQRFGRPEAALLVPTVCVPLAGAMLALVVLSPSLPVAIVAIGLTNFFVASIMGPCVAAAIQLAPLQMRALASTAMLFSHAIVGTAAAPMVVGAISDHLQPSLGEESLRYALVIVAVAPLAASLLFWTAFRKIRAENPAAATEPVPA